MNRTLRNRAPARALTIVSVIAAMIPVGSSAVPAAAAPLVCLLSHSCPTITAVSPDFGPAETVTISGTNLPKVTTVLFGALPSPSFHYVPRGARLAGDWIVATPPAGQPGSTVPVSGLAGAVPVPSTASYSYPLGDIDVTGPLPHCADDPYENEHNGDWGYDVTNGSGAGHVINLSGAGPTLAFATSGAVFHISTEFDNDSSYWPFAYVPVFPGTTTTGGEATAMDCPDGYVTVGTGATYTARRSRFCEVTPGARPPRRPTRLGHPWGRAPTGTGYRGPGWRSRP